MIKEYLVPFLLCVTIGIVIAQSIWWVFERRRLLAQINILTNRYRSKMDPETLKHLDSLTRRKSEFRSNQPEVLGVKHRANLSKHHRLSGISVADFNKLKGERA